MSTPITGPVLCRCGWTGTLTGEAPCGGGCGASWQQRVTPMRLLALRAVAERSDAGLNPSVRHKLIGMGLIAPPGKRPPAGTSRIRGAKRHHVVTAAGAHVLACARIAEQTRHDVAASVARHSDLDRHFERMAPVIDAINAGMKRTP